MRWVARIFDLAHCSLKGRPYLPLLRLVLRHFLLALGSLLLFSRLAAAQLASGAPVKVTLHSELLAARPSIYVERVVDGRSFPEPLGLVVRGLNNTLREVYLKQGLTQELHALLLNQLPHTGARPVLLRVTSVGISETSTGVFTIQAAAELAAEWYARQSDSTYYLLCRTFHTTQRPGGPELGSSHAANLVQLLSASLDQLDRADWAAQQAAGPWYQAAQLRQPLPVQPYPVQSGAPLQPGIYDSFFEFRHNAPGRPGAVSADARAYHSNEWQGLRAVEPFLLTPEGQRAAVRDAWGFCDGHQAYVRFGRDYFLLEQRGSAYMFFAPSVYNGNNTLLFNGGPAKTAYSLHLPSGLISAYAGPTGLVSLRPEGRPTHLMVYWRREKNAPPLPVRLNGQPAGELRAGDYLSLPWQGAAGQSVRLCVGPDACLELKPSFTEGNYIEFQPGAAVLLRTVPVREGKVQVNRMVGR